MPFLFRKAGLCHSSYKAVCRLKANAEFPYPSNEQKQRWANSGKVTRSQIDCFLTNNRKRQTCCASMLERTGSCESVLSSATTPPSTTVAAAATTDTAAQERELVAELDAAVARKATGLGAAAAARAPPAMKAEPLDIPES